MELTKQTLRKFLDERPAISEGKLAIEAGLNDKYIYQLYNKADNDMSKVGREKLLKILPKYGFDIASH